MPVTSCQLATAPTFGEGSLPSTRPYLVSLLQEQHMSLRESELSHVNEAPRLECFLELERMMQPRHREELGGIFSDTQVTGLLGLHEAYASWIVYSDLNEAALAAQRQGQEVTSRMRNRDGIPDNRKSASYRRQEALIAEELESSVAVGGQAVIAQAERGARTHLLSRFDNLFEV